MGFTWGYMYVYTHVSGFDEIKWDFIGICEDFMGINRI